MTVHHLDCGTMCPALARLTEIDEMVCHCLVVETERDGLVLVDTGFGTQDCADPSRLARSFRWAVRPRLDRAQCAKTQLERLGFRASDVRHVVVTHLDVDHAGGLHDFPDATVHVHRREHDAARQRRKLKDRERYVPHQWSHGPRWALYEPDGETWMGLPSVSLLKGVRDEVALVPLLGHSRGHSAVAVRAGDGWILHCGDGFFDRRELVPGATPPRGLRAFAAAVQHDPARRHASVATLQRLAATRPEVRIVCSHDPVMFADARAA